MAVIATLTPTPIPGNTQNGGVLGTMMFHVTVAPAGGAGTYKFPHNLPWTPTYCHVVAQLAEGNTPTTSNSVVAWCFADTDATNVAINVAGNGTYHVYYC